MIDDLSVLLLCQVRVGGCDVRVNNLHGIMSTRRVLRGQQPTHFNGNFNENFYTVKIFTHAVNTLSELSDITGKVTVLCYILHFQDFL